MFRCVFVARFFCEVRLFKCVSLFFYYLCVNVRVGCVSIHVFVFCVCVLVCVLCVQVFEFFVCLYVSMFVYVLVCPFV